MLSHNFFLIKFNLLYFLCAFVVKSFVLVNIQVKTNYLQKYFFS